MNSCLRKSPTTKDVVLPAMAARRVAARRRTGGHGTGSVGKGQEPSLLQRGGASPLRAHARRGRARLQHPVQLLQPQIRLRQRIAARCGQRETDARTGIEKGARSGFRDSADDGARHCRSRRPPGQSCQDLQDVRADCQNCTRHQAVPVHQRAGIARPCGRPSSLSTWIT